MYSSRKTPIIMRRQRGAVFLVMLVIMIVGIAAFLVSSLNSSALQLKRDEVTANALAQAKEALIGRAASDSTIPGQLPCPEDTSLIGHANEGQALPTCNTLPAIGRLPWRTLGLGDLRDGNGDRLWYVLSDGFRGGPGKPLNSDTPAQLTVDGVPAVAIIFSPGPPIAGQSRPVPTDTTAPDKIQYLELSNSAGGNTFVSTGPSNTFNDKLLIITHDDLFRVVEKRIAKEVVNALNDYYSVNHFYPVPSNFGDTSCLGITPLAACNSGASNRGRIPANPLPAWDSFSILDGNNAAGAWFRANAWREVIFYAVATPCADVLFPNCTGSGTYLTLNNPLGTALSNQKVVVIATGAALATTTVPQTRSNPTLQTTLSNYLEDENLTPLDDTYTRSVASPTTPFNDIAISIP